MKVLEILTIEFKKGGTQCHQILHQEGWDFRNTKKSKEGYVRWTNAFYVVSHEGESNIIYLRGSAEKYDLRPSVGKIEFDKITEFFNSSESPLQLQPSNGKRSITTFNESDLEEMKRDLGREYKIEHKYIKTEREVGYPIIVAVMEQMTYPLSSRTSEDETIWLLERFTWKPLPKREVVMTCYTNENEPDVLIERRTWTLK